MEITLIHGQGHKGSTYHVASMMKKLLADNGTKVHEYYMPKDTPGFCAGCFQCFQKGEEYCPQADKVQKIVESMRRSEVIIIDSPTYCLEMTGQLKTLFDHLGYMWMSHRPRKEMFSKIGIALSTTAGAGAKRVTKSIARQMSWWGVPKIYRMHFSVNASCWEDVPDRIKKKISQETRKLSGNIKKMVGKAKPGFKTMFLFNIMRKMQQSNTWNMTDRNYWQENNWLEEGRPWK
ncbi:MAG: NAD(P)H-dependent oxidoreductase [Clostridiaceae bacterium]|nr:NAD(P)H-dependent oxidoreductase [Clostridiaceae bacterium]